MVNVVSVVSFVCCVHVDAQGADNETGVFQDCRVHQRMTEWGQAKQRLMTALEEHRFQDADAMIASDPHFTTYRKACPKPFADEDDFFQCDGPLHWAIYPMADADIVRYFLERGADPNLWGYACEVSPFHDLCTSPDVDIDSATLDEYMTMFRLMLDFGADPHRPDYMKRTPIMDLTDTETFPDTPLRRAMLDELRLRGHSVEEPRAG